MAIPLSSVGSFPCSLNEPIYDSCCLNTVGQSARLLKFATDLFLFEHTFLGPGNPQLLTNSIHKSIYEIKQLIVSISPSGLFSILHRTVHFRSSLINTPCNNHFHVVLFQFAQYQFVKNKHQLVGF